MLPLFPGIDPGLERRGREDRPQFGYSAGAVYGREWSEVSCRESAGRIFGDRFRPALASVCVSVRITSEHKTPLPGNRGWISPQPVAWWAFGLGVKLG